MDFYSLPFRYIDLILKNRETVLDLSINYPDDWIIFRITVFYLLFVCFKKSCMLSSFTKIILIYLSKKFFKLKATLIIKKT